MAYVDRFLYYALKVYAWLVVQKSILMSSKTYSNVLGRTFAL